MTWADRPWRSRSAADEPPSADAPPESITRRSPGLEALFSRLEGDGRHSVLDLGPAQGGQLRLLGRFGRTVRFAGLIPRTSGHPGWLDELRSLPAHPERPYDVVLLWDLLDRLPAGERPAVLERIATVTAGSARLYAVIDASGAASRPPLHFTIADTGHVTQTPAGPPEPAQEPLLPAHVERALVPFEVVHAFTLRSGLREYVGVKRG